VWSAHAVASAGAAHLAHAIIDDDLVVDGVADQREDGGDRGQVELEILD